MFELSPELKVLMRASRSASLPTEADSARIFEALCARLGNAAMGADTAQPSVTGTSSGFTLGKASTVSFAGLALLGGLWFFTARAQRAVPLETNAAASAAATISVAVVAIPSAAPSSERASVAREGTEVETVAKDESNRAEAHPAASHHARDTLAQEVALLSRAETALHRGKAAVALEALSEHERRFGNGLLKEERIAARVQALCALGRNAEADAQLAQLSSQSLATLRLCACRIGGCDERLSSNLAAFATHEAKTREA